MDLKGQFSKKITDIFEDRSISGRFVQVFLVFLTVFIFYGLITHGNSIRLAFFVDEHDVFMDFFNSIMYSSDYPYHKYHVIYPPLITLFYGAVGYYLIPTLRPYYDTNTNFIEGNIAFQLRNSQQGLMLYFILVLLLILIVYELNSKLMSSDVKHPRLTSLLIIFSFPMMYAIERGNSILFLVPLVTLFVMWYDSENRYKRYVAFLMLGLAASIKIYVVLFMLLLIHRRAFKDLILCLIPLLVFFFIPFLITDGSAFNWFNNSFGFTGSDTTFSFINIRTTANAPTLILPETICEWLYRILLLALYALTLLCILFVRPAKKWKLVALISCVISLGIGSGSTYNWLFFAICFILFISEEKEIRPDNRLYFWLFILILCWLPAILVKEYAYELRSIAVILLCVTLFRSFLRGLRSSHAKSEKTHKERISVGHLGVYVLTMGLVACAIAVPLITEGDSLTVTNRGYNDMRLIGDGETVDFSYDPAKNILTVGGDIHRWTEIDGLSILSTDKGYLSDEILMYIDSSDNRITKTISGQVTGNVGGNQVHLECNGWSADWSYLSFAFLFSDKDDYTCFSNCLPDWRIFLENESQVYSVFYSDVADKLIAVNGTTSYSNGILSADSVSYSINRTDAGFGPLGFIWNKAGSATVSLGTDKTACLPAYIVPTEVHTTKDVPNDERSFIFVLLASIISITALGAIVLRSERLS